MGKCFSHKKENQGFLLGLSDGHNGHPPPINGLIILYDTTQLCVKPNNIVYYSLILCVI